MRAALLALLLAALPSARCWDHGVGEREFRPRRPSFCDEHLEALSQHDVQQLRDLFQEWMQHRRVEKDMTDLAHRMRNPPTDPADTFAWKTSLSLSAVEARGANATSSRKRLAGIIEYVVGRLREGGQLKQTTTDQDLVHCTSAHLNPQRFPDRPVVSLMLQYFRRPAVIPFAANLVQACAKLLPTELLVNVDSPEEGQAWADLSWASEGLVVPVFSNNVHELRAYNRMAGLARGRVLVILQDDDSLKPENCSWLPALVRQFDAMPKLGMVGLKSYRRGCGFGNSERWTDTFRLFKDGDTDAFFTFPMFVDYAPMALRRSALRSVGGVDEGMGDVGMCGICSDWEMSTRMWVAGWHVGFMPLVEKGRVDALEGTTHLPANVKRCWARQYDLGNTIYQARWGNGWGYGVGRFLEALENEIRILNLQLLEPAYGLQCPFRKGCTNLTGNPPLPLKYAGDYLDKVVPLVEA